MRLLGRRGSLFVTVWGNNSSLPTTVTFLRGRSSLCHSWIQYQGSPDTPDPHIPTLVYNSCCEIVMFQGNGRWCVYEHLTSVYAAFLPLCLFMNRAFILDVYQRNFPRRHKMAVMQRAAEGKCKLRMVQMLPRKLHTGYICLPVKMPVRKFPAGTH